MNPLLIVLDGILSQQECTDLIAKADNMDLQLTERGVNGNNDNSNAVYYRSEINDPDLAQILLQRLLPFIPREYNIISILPEFRLAKYKDGGSFPMHKDGIKQDRNTGNRSILTLNIFLNDNFEGGETDFYLEDQTTLRMRASPKTGTGALFYSRQYHCGNEVKNGYKYLLRSYLMTRN